MVQEKSDIYFLNRVKRYMDALLTYIIIGFTCLISIPAFSNEKLMNDMIFYPPAIQRGQYYRFITYGFLHADFTHLIFNMLSLYFFGPMLEQNFQLSFVFGGLGKTMFLLLYISALVVCLLPTYFKNKDNYHYRSLGASGAVSAVVFVGICLFPDAKLGLFIIPPIIPGIIFGPVYLLISAYLDRRGSDNINHSAHFWGALYGVAFLFIVSKIFGYDAIGNFVERVKGVFS
jgi:membrane associated rhomboid family serine protease